MVYHKTSQKEELSIDEPHFILFLFYLMSKQQLCYSFGGGLIAFFKTLSRKLDALGNFSSTVDPCGRDNVRKR